MDFIEQKKLGKRTINYRLKDWLLSRQRYWGNPIPIIYCDKCGMVTVPEKDLPVKLPLDIKIESQSGSPLAKSDSFCEYYLSKMWRQSQKRNRYTWIHL